MGSVSPSEALSQAYEDYQGRLTEILARFQVPNDWRRGGLRGRGPPRGARTLRPAGDPGEILAQADPVLRARRPGARAPCPALDGRIGEPVGASRGPAQGRSVPIAGARHGPPALRGGVSGASLVVDDYPVHLELFPVDPPATP